MLKIDLNTFRLMRRPVRIRRYESGDHATPAKTVDFSYDPAGNPTGYSDGVASAVYVYDDLYRKIRETVDYGPFSLSYGYAYYRNGLKKSFAGPDGIEYAYAYDANNQLVEIKIPELGSATVNEYRWNRPARITLPGGTSKIYAYDPLMRVERIESRDPAGNSPMQYSYEYDRMGNIMAKETEHGAYAYDYDELYRLTMADNPTSTDESYAYDPVGNRLASSEYNDRTYNADNELIGYDGVSFEYDENGNTVRKTEGSETTRYIYNVENRLERVEDSAGNVIAAYCYDPFGRRLWKEVSVARTCYLYADEGLVGEYEADGSEIRTYGWKPGGAWTTDPLFMKVGAGYFFYHNDHLVTPQRMTATNGEVVWRAKHSSFGKSTVEVETVENNMMFPGQYYDGETGTHYNWNRYFEPEIGRYLREDPIGFWGGINMYLYVSNNPMISIDPFRLKVYKCQRPLKPGNPGDKIPFHKRVLKLYHEYNCITLPDGSMKCDSTSPGPRWPQHMEPGVPSDPKDDYYHPDACEEIDGDADFCVEHCLQKKWAQPRPPYDIGPGTDCQKYSCDTFSDCVKSCQVKNP